jgi:hypothetical protein
MQAKNKTKQDYFHEKIMLLGAGGEYLQARRKIRLELEGIGYNNVIIMEDSTDIPTDRSLDEKFGRILKDDVPAFFFAIFHNGARMDGVTFELGWLCSIFTASKMSKRLRILHEEKYRWTATTAYIRSLFTNVPHIPFNESNPYSKASAYIDKCIMYMK